MPVDVDFQVIAVVPRQNRGGQQCLELSDPCRARTAQRRAATTRGQVSHKPRGIKPRRTPPLVFKADLTTTSFAYPGIQGVTRVRERHDALAVIGTHVGRNDRGGAVAQRLAERSSDSIAATR